jgi:hypothetical protein
VIGRLIRVQLREQPLTIALIEAGQHDGALSAEIARDCAPDVLLSDAGARLLEGSLSRDQRRKDGVFFSGLELADYVAGRVKHLISEGATIADPTCGGGDLLLACLRLFPAAEDAQLAAQSWGKRVKGFDLQSSFAEAARLRLAALALDAHKGSSVSMAELSSAFKGIMQGDYMQNATHLSDMDVIVANPPFGSICAPPLCDWSTGKTQRAAIFLDEMVEHAKPHQNIVAVLPDVLRSGSRYQRWRAKVEQRCKVLDIHRYGRFGDSADIDVFVLHVEKRAAMDRPPAAPQWADTAAPVGGVKLSERFDVRIGPVVPHRHGNTGGWCYYLDVGSSVPNAEVCVSAKRRFAGKLALPPFVVVRRTTSPSDRQRVVPTLVRADGPVAVENHLVILSPKSGGLAACRRLMAQLKTDEVHQWVNTANGCRHLTKGQVENIPIKED